MTAWCTGARSVSYTQILPIHKQVRFTRRIQTLDGDFSFSFVCLHYNKDGVIFIFTHFSDTI